MPMYYGFKSHRQGRYYHFGLGSTGFLHRFHSDVERQRWLKETGPDFPRFIVKSTDLVRMSVNVTDEAVLMVHQIPGLI